MEEKRKYPREELAAAMICAFDVGAVSTFCLVKNVSVEGALVECPLSDELEPFDVSDSVVMSDILKGSKAIFHETKAEIAWVYKRFLGVHFAERLMASSDELRDWLGGQDIL